MSGALALLLLACGGARAAMPGGGASAGLGEVDFGVSCREDVRASFDHAVALVHSFWHDEAEREFRGIAQRDPDCAMAWWGVAITHAHQLLATPTSEDGAAGRDALKRADLAQSKNAREAAYLRALQALFDGLPDPAERYASAMGEVAKAWPKDIEAKAFFGLALIAAAAPDDASLTHQKQAVAVLSPAFKAHPDHPGFAHYLIHATDNPSMAKLGLEAARRYAAIAPAAPHALHMPSHIFARLGLWSEDIESNLASRDAAQRELDAGHAGAEALMHALEFLQYAYLQRGDADAAAGILNAARRVNAAQVDARYANYHATFQARVGALQLIETQDWAAARALRPAPDTPWSSQQLTFLAQAMAAGFQRDADAGVHAARDIDALLAKLEQRPPADRLGTVDEIHAWAAFARGESDAAIALLRPVADRQSRIGKGEVELPAREMIGQMLLLDGSSLPALKEFEASLAVDPGRFQSLLGAGRAAESLGRRQDAIRHYRALMQNCPSPSGAPAEQLDTARTYLEAAGIVVTP